MMTLENKKRNIRILLSFCSVAIIAWLGIRAVAAHKSNAKAFDENLPSVYTISTQDSNLIAHQYRKELKVIEVRRSKVRGNVTVLSIGDEYTVILQKLKFVQGSSLTKAIHIVEASTDRSTMVSYSIINLGDFSYQYRAGSVEPVSDLFLTLSGTAMKNLQENDSLVSYSLQATDTYITVKGGFTRKAIPMNIMLLKKEDAVYFIVLFAKDGKELAMPDAIHEIIKVAA
jgi:hypothetical protein